MPRARVTAISLLWILVGNPGNAQRSDTTIVRVGAPVHPGVGALVEELTLGSGSNAGEYRFTAPFVFNGPDGGAYVVDVSNPWGPGAYQTIVRQYDAAGKFVRAFGGTGQGPGEYTGILRDVKTLADGRVLVLERSAVLVYTATGDSLGRWRTRDVAAHLFVDPAGFVHVSGTSREAGRPGPFLHRFGLDGKLVDDSAHPAAAFPDPPKLSDGLLPFASRHLVKWSPLGYFVTVNTANYAIDLRMPSRAGARWVQGDPVLSIRRTVPPIALSSAERADWRESLTFYWRRQNPKWEWDAPELSHTKPPISGLQVADDGRIWVRVSQPATLNPAVVLRTGAVPGFVDIDAERRWVEPWVYDVFEPAGRYVGQVQFPDNTPPPHLARMEFAIRGDVVWGVVYDRDGTPRVKRYRIAWAR
jgi:hypothetical protein